RSSTTTTLGEGTLRTCVQRAASFEEPLALARTVAVAAYPTITPRSGNMQRTSIFAKPSSRGRTSKVSIAFERVGVSWRLRAARTSADSWVTSRIALGGSLAHRIFASEGPDHARGLLPKEDRIGSDVQHLEASLPPVPGDLGAAAVDARHHSLALAGCEHGLDHPSLLVSPAITAGLEPVSHG